LPTQILVIDSDGVKDWTQWEQFLATLDKDDIEESEYHQMIQSGELIGVLEDRFGWDFIVKVADGFVIGDRNAGVPTHVKTATPYAIFEQAAKIVQGVPVDPGQWTERFLEHQEMDEEEDEDDEF